MEDAGASAIARTVAASVRTTAAVVNVVFPAAVFVLAAYSSLWSIAFPAGLGLLVAVVAILKVLVGRERPDRTDRMSFPSGHAAVSTYLAGVYVFFIPTILWLKAAVFVWAVVSCLARVVAKRHYKSDVIAGALLASCAVATLNFFEA